MARKEAMVKADSVRNCDNHPEVAAVLVSDLGGRLSHEIALCTDCVIPELNEYVG